METPVEFKIAILEDHMRETAHLLFRWKWIAQLKRRLHRSLYTRNQLVIIVICVRSFNDNGEPLAWCLERWGKHEHDGQIVSGRWAGKVERARI